MVHVHLSVGDYSKDFQNKLRRVNHVTPKNYLDFIGSYTKLLKQKDKFVLDQVMGTCHVHYWYCLYKYSVILGSQYLYSLLGNVHAIGSGCIAV